MMKFVKFLLIALVFAMVCVPRAKCQVRPNEFQEELNPNDANFETYSQKGGVNRRASLGNLKRYFTPVVFGVIGYIPTPSGNASNRMEFVTDPNGDKWFIDATGKATQLGKSYTGGAGITITGATIAAADPSATNEIQRLDTLAIVGGNLRVSLLNDGVPFSTVALPVADGSETKVNAGTGTTVTGLGTVASPYVVNNTGDTNPNDDVTGAGTSGYLPIFSTSNSINNSSLRQGTVNSLSAFGINATPDYRLHVSTNGGPGQVQGLKIESAGWESVFFDPYSANAPYQRGLNVGALNASSQRVNDLLVLNAFDGAVGLNIKYPVHRLQIRGINDTKYMVLEREGDSTKVFTSLVNGEGDAVLRSKTGFFTFGKQALSASAQNPQANVHLFGSSGATVDTLFALEKSGGYGIMRLEQFYNSTFELGTHINIQGNRIATFSTIFGGSPRLGVNQVLPQRTLHVSGDARITGNVGNGGNIMLRDALGDIRNATSLVGLTVSGTTVTNTGDIDATNDLVVTTTFSGDITGTWNTLQIAPGVVGTTELENASVTLQKMAASSVNSSIITNGSISALDFNDQGASTGQALAYGGAGVGFVPTSSGGDCSGPLTNLQITANAVGSSEISDNAVGSSEITNNSILPNDLFFANYSAGSTVYSDGASWVFGQNKVVSYFDINGGGGTGGIALSGNRVDNYLRGANWTSLSVTMPPAPADGQEATITFDVTATAVTWSGNGYSIQGSLPTSIAQGDTFKFKFYNATTKWHRINY